MVTKSGRAAKPLDVYDIYARVSQVKRNQKRELSTDGQVAVCRLRLVDLGFAEGEVLVDLGRSAWNPAVKRPAWEELMDRLERRVSRGFIVFDLERFTRQPKDGERMINLAAAGLLVLDSESEYDLTTPNGKKAFRDAINAAAYYSDRLSTRVARGKKLRAMAGEANSSSRSFGFEEDRVTIREDEAEIIRELTRRFLAGEPQNTLVRDLNARGILSSLGNTWKAETLRSLLMRESNCGRVVYTDAAMGVRSVVGRLPGEPIISEDDFDRLHAMYEARRLVESHSPAYLCTGIVVCGRPDCGQPLNGALAKNSKPYDDGSVRREYKCRSCYKLSIDQRGLDQAAEALAVEILSDPRHANEIEAASQEVESEAARLDMAIAEAESVTEALAGRLGRGEITLSRYDIAIRPLDERITKLRDERAALGEIASERPQRASREHWQRRWNKAAEEERRELLRMALRERRLIVDPASLKRAERSDVTRRVRIGSGRDGNLTDATVTIADVIAAQEGHDDLMSTIGGPQAKWSSRRTFTPEYKRRILDEYENAGSGERGAIVRREGLHFSTITYWRRSKIG